MFVNKFQLKRKTNFQIKHCNYFFYDIHLLFPTLIILCLTLKLPKTLIMCNTNSLTNELDDLLITHSK